MEYGSKEQEEEISRTMGCLREELRGNVVEQNRGSTSTMSTKTLGSHKWSLQKNWPSFCVCISQQEWELDL